jgi:ferredoxin-type protein NapH
MARAVGILALAFVLAVAIGGYWLRALGLLLALMMGTAIVLSLAAPKPRTFCSRVCPRGRALGFALGPFSRRRPLPPLLTKPGFRRGFCGFMMICVLGNLFRIPAGPGFASGAGSVFWVLCLVSLGAGIGLGLLFKPRAWCAVCPLGTLQDTLRPAGKPEAGGGNR